MISPENLFSSVIYNILWFHTVSCGRAQFRFQRKKLTLQINIDWQVIAPNKGMHVPNQILIQTTVWPVFVVHTAGYIQ